MDFTYWSAKRETITHLIRTRQHDGRPHGSVDHRILLLLSLFGQLVIIKHNLENGRWRRETSVRPPEHRPIAAADDDDDDIVINYNDIIPIRRDGSRREKLL